MNDQQQPDYRQQLGLKKILYKYENQNQQLRSQIKALNERLQWILTKPKTPEQKPKLNPIQEYQGQLLKQEMAKLYKEINHQSVEMKSNKDGIDERHEQKCTQLENRIVREDKEMKELRYKLEKYEKIDEGIRLGEILGKTSNISSFNSNTIAQSPLQSPSPITTTPQPNKQFDPSILLMASNNKTLRNSTIRVQNYLQKLTSIKQETQAVRKSIKELQHLRDNNQRSLIKKHLYQNDCKEVNRGLENGGRGEGGGVGEENVGGKRKGIWGLENTKQNHDFIRQQLQRLQKQKHSLLQTIRTENIVLQNKVKQLSIQLQSLDKSVQIPPLPYQKRPSKIPIDLSMSTKMQSPLLQKKLLQPIQPPPTITQFQRKNDKNFVPKAPHRVQWQSPKPTSGIQWSDTHMRSPINGVNLWFDGCLIGIEFLHQLGSSGQHLQVMGGKKLTPIQYRLNAGDYVENVVLYVLEGLISGVEFVSRMGRVDRFGNINKAKKHDMGIKKQEKPIASFGMFRINNNVSEITKLGFEVI